MSQWRMRRFSPIFSFGLIFMLSGCSQDIMPLDPQDQDAATRADVSMTSPDSGSSFPDAQTAPSDTGTNPSQDSGTPPRIDAGDMTKDATAATDATTPRPDSGVSRDASIRDARAPDAQVQNPDSGVGRIDAGSGVCSCTNQEYCDNTTQYSCSGQGMCQPRPMACNRILRPVCGCDKMDYPNECEANRAGVDIRHEGGCDCRDLGCPSNETCQPCRSQTGLTYICLPAGVAC